MLHCYFIRGSAFDSNRVGSGLELVETKNAIIVSLGTLRNEVRAIESNLDSFVRSHRRVRKINFALYRMNSAACTWKSPSTTDTALAKHDQGEQHGTKNECRDSCCVDEEMTYRKIHDLFPL